MTLSGLILPLGRTDLTKCLSLLLLARGRVLLAFLALLLGPRLAPFTGLRRNLLLVSSRLLLAILLLLLLLLLTLGRIGTLPPGLLLGPGLVIPTLPTLLSRKLGLLSLLETLRVPTLPLLILALESLLRILLAPDLLLPGTLTFRVSVVVRTALLRPNLPFLRLKELTPSPALVILLIPGGPSSLTPPTDVGTPNLGTPTVVTGLVFGPLGLVLNLGIPLGLPRDVLSPTTLLGTLLLSATLVLPITLTDLLGNLLPLLRAPFLKILSTFPETPLRTFLTSIRILGLPPLAALLILLVLGLLRVPILALAPPPLSLPVRLGARSPGINRPLNPVPLVFASLFTSTPRLQVPTIHPFLSN